MNHWSHTWCTNGCKVVVWQYDPGGKYYERPEGQREREHQCSELLSEGTKGQKA